MKVFPKLPIKPNSTNSKVVVKRPVMVVKRNPCANGRCRVNSTEKINEE